MKAWRNKTTELAKQTERTLDRAATGFDDMLRRFWQNPLSAGMSDLWREGGTWGPRMDLSETETEVTARFELPGMRPEDMDIQVAGGLLTVRGERKEEKKEQRGACHYSERSYGSFSRSVQLPSTIDPDKVDASYKDGVLSVTLAKHPDAQPRKVNVRNT